MMLRSAALAAVASALCLCGPVLARAEAPPPVASGTEAYKAVVRKEAEAQGLPPEIADAVATVESGWRADAVGSVGEIGLMQVRPATAAMLGHEGGTLGLFDPEVNARYGVRYLAQAWRLAGGDLCRALMKYRAGHGAETLSPLSATYCRRAKARLAALGSPLADGVAPDVIAPAPVADAPASKPRRPRYYLGWRPGPKTEADNRRFWAAHEARITALTARLEARQSARAARVARRD